MIKQNDQESVQKSNSASTVIITILLTALIVGGVVYAWQQSQLNSTETELQGQISSLQNQILKTNKKIADQKVTSKTEDKDVAENESKDSQNQTTLTKSKEDSKYIYYSGTITVNGKYQELLGNTSPLSNILCFYPDETTKDLIPRESDDTRSEWFCFDSQDKDKTAFGINDESTSLAKVSCIEGKATVKISGYKATKIQGESSDTAVLDSIVSKEVYKTSCSN